MDAPCDLQQSEEVEKIRDGVVVDRVGDKDRMKSIQYPTVY